MRTDIVRLHDVALGNIRERRVGKTTLTCHEVAGVIELNIVKTIIARLKKTSDIFYILPMLLETLKEHEICIEGKYHRQFQKFVGDSFEIKFISQNQFNVLTRGLSDYYVADFIDY